MLSRADLYPYQATAIDFIKTHPSCALWLEPGLGKSVSTLTAFGDLLNDFDATKMLVVAPKRVAQRVWDAEIEGWSHLQGLRVAKMIGTEKQRLAAMAAAADVFTINRENVQWLESVIAPNRKQVRPWPWDMVVLDESQSFKSQSSQRWKSLKRLRQLFSRCVQLTGTPAPNGYSDLWSQLYLLDRGTRLGQTETAYRERWFTPINYGNQYTDWVIRPGSAEEIQAAIADIVLSMKTEDYLDLPPVTYNRINVPLSAAVMKQYRALARSYVMELASGFVVTAKNAGACRSKLLQLANGSIYVDDQGHYETLHDEKLAALEETLDGLPSPVLIGYSFCADRERITSALARTRGKDSYRVLDRECDFDDFAAGRIEYGVAHPGSMGHGLNDLYRSGAENAVWFGLTDNLEFYLQFNARLTGGHRRSGRAVVIHHILCDNTQDEETFALITRKGITQDDLTSNIRKLVGQV